MSRLEARETKIGKSKLLWVSTLVLLTGLASSCASQRPNIQQMIADAKTPADHYAIAEYYDRQAADAEETARSHEALSEQYWRFRAKWDLDSHCKKIAKYYEGIAQQDSELAASHRALAAQGH